MSSSMDSSASPSSFPEAVTVTVEQLLHRGIFVVGFGFPVVPEGAARLRIQMSAAHSDQHIDRALDAFEALRS